MYVTLHYVKHKRCLRCINAVCAGKKNNMCSIYIFTKFVVQLGALRSKRDNKWLIDKWLKTRMTFSYLLIGFNGSVHPEGFFLILLQRHIILLFNVLFT